MGCPSAEVTPELQRIHTLRGLPQRMGGLGVYPYAGPHTVAGTNASRLEAYAFVSKHYHFTLDVQATNSWPPLELSYGGTETSHTLTKEEVSAELSLGAKEDLQRLLDAASPADAAWLRSSATPNSARWLNFRGGLHRRFWMRDMLFVFALRRRCLISRSPAEESVAHRGCACALHLKAHTTHLLDCPSRQWYFGQRHKLAIGLLRDLIKAVRPDALIQLEPELPDAVPAGEVAPAPLRRGARPKRADLLVVLMPNEQFTIDVSFVNPACVTMLKEGTAEAEDKAALHREQRKWDKYQDTPGCEKGGVRGFRPFVVESTGRFGPEAMKILKEIVPSDQTYHLSHFYNAFSAMVTLYNALMLNGAMHKLTTLERIEF